MDTILKFLCNNHSKSISRCIGFHDKLFGPVRCAKDWVTAANFFQLEEGIIAFLRPNELFVFASCNVREVFYKHSVEVAEPQEALYILDCLGSGPFGDSLNFDRVHLDRAVANDHSKVFDLALIEFTLLWLEK